MFVYDAAVYFFAFSFVWHATSLLHSLINKRRVSFSSHSNRVENMHIFQCVFALILTAWALYAFNFADLYISDMIRVFVVYVAFKAVIGIVSEKSAVFGYIIYNIALLKKFDLRGLVARNLSAAATLQRDVEVFICCIVLLAIIR